MPFLELDNLFWKIEGAKSKAYFNFIKSLNLK